jgi:hypothetical protein
MCWTSTATPSHLGGGNHQELQEIHSHNDPQVPLDAITQAMHLESLNLTLNLQPSKRDEWEGVFSAHKDVKNIKSPREMAWSRPPSIYRAPDEIEPLGSHKPIERT